MMLPGQCRAFCHQLVRITKFHGQREYTYEALPPLGNWQILCQRWG